MKYRTDVNNVEEGKGIKIKIKRGSKNNLTIGAFGIHQVNTESFKVIPKHLRTPETCNECGVLGRKIPFVPKVKQQIARATRKGAIPSVYKPYKSHNKYTPNSRGKVK